MQYLIKMEEIKKKLYNEIKNIWIDDYIFSELENIISPMHYYKINNIYNNKEFLLDYLNFLNESFISIKLDKNINIQKDFFSNWLKWFIFLLLNEISNSSKTRIFLNERYFRKKILK